jgi:hypothetical protein
LYVSETASAGAKSGGFLSYYTEEATQLATPIGRMKVEQGAMQARLNALQTENIEPAKILGQLNALADDARA